MIDLAYNEVLILLIARESCSVSKFRFFPPNNQVAQGKESVYLQRGKVGQNNIKVQDTTEKKEAKKM